MEEQEQVTTLDITIYPAGCDGIIRPALMIGGPSELVTVIVEAHQDEDDPNLAHMSITAGNIPGENAEKARASLVECLEWVLEVVRESTEVVA